MNKETIKNMENNDLYAALKSINDYMDKLEAHLLGVGESTFDDEDWKAALSLSVAMTKELKRRRLEGTDRPAKPFDFG